MPGGRCIECDNGDWYCPEENGGLGPGDCPAGGGLSEWRKAGEVWYDKQGPLHRGYSVWTRLRGSGNEPKVDVWLAKIWMEPDTGALLWREDLAIPMAIAELTKSHPDLDLSKLP